jgi:hypothetical protein
MGTNYYVRTKPSCGGKCADHCHGEDIHLGKSSAGWAFTFRAYPDAGQAPEAVTWPVMDAESWMRLLDLGNIYDEYGRIMTSVELLFLIEQKIGGKNDLCSSAEFIDASGARFIAVSFS